MHLFGGKNRFFTPRLLLGLSSSSELFTSFGGPSSSSPDTDFSVSASATMHFLVSRGLSGPDVGDIDFDLPASSFIAFFTALALSRLAFFPVVVAVVVDGLTTDGGLEGCRNRAEQDGALCSHLDCA